MEEYFNNPEFIKNLEVLYNYMNMHQKIEKSDLIIGCGCSDLRVPVKCAELYNEGWAPKILFAGGLGKLTEKIFKKSEAEVFRDIAISHGVADTDILVEDKSTNTGDNFRFALALIKENNLNVNSIIIVHRKSNEQRTYRAARAIIKDKKIFITSAKESFAEYLNYIKGNNNIESVNVLVGDIQRMIIYPQFGWQEEVDVPKNVIDAYRYLKELGFSKYIYNKEKIAFYLDKYGLSKDNANYFN